MAKKKSDKESNRNKKPSVNKELEGFDIKIDTFGEIQTTFEIDKINEFLNKNVKDKKLDNREDWPKKKDSKNTYEEE